MTLSTPPDQTTPEQQFLPFDRPLPPLVEAQLRNTDIEITDALTPLTPYVNADHAPASYNDLLSYYNQRDDKVIDLHLIGTNHPR